ncbi:glutaredoxin 3 [Amaricoccus tamworthensis]|uniref:glutaredoxin 3 n=1 Tax=Amaricoccus tamworthensis TaxID=57002 RepID=UPI003C7E8926
MKQVTLYTSPICGYCFAAKKLLSNKGVSFEEIDVVRNPEMRREMETRSNGGRTVPQIFIGETHVGGFDDMNALERQGKLDPLLAG